jgi:DNA-binding transcriptional regulator LsrR (DeoR family)
MKKEDLLRLVEICRLYYEKESTQANIAKTLNISRPAVSKLLSEARHRGIVKIEIRSPFDSDDDLMNQLIRMFGLKDGLIIPSATKNDGLNRRLIVSQSVVYLQKILPEIKKLGIGWGQTIRDIIEEFEVQTPGNKEKGGICPVIGSSPSAVQWLQTNELARILAEKIGFTPYYLHAPAFPFSENDRQLFMGTIEGQQISALWAELDTILLGVGTYPTVPDQATAVRFGDLLKQRKAVGVLATYYYDIQGRIIESPGDIAVRIPLEYLKKTKRVIVVSGSPKKIRALRGALMTGLVSHLITDEGTARELIKYHQEVS